MLEIPATKAALFDEYVRRSKSVSARRATVIRREYLRGDPSEHPFEPISWPG
jgi:hypothetical protein